MQHARTTSEHSPHLRLVFSDRGIPLRDAEIRARVEHENKDASRFARQEDPSAQRDLREIFAIKATSELEGGRAAILRPDRRQALVRDARRAGLRAFEANLIIAVAQDAARRGESAGAAPTVQLLRRIPASGTPADSPASITLRIMTAIVLAIAGLIVLAGWLTGQ